MSLQLNGILMYPHCFHGCGLSSARQFFSPKWTEHVAQLICSLGKNRGFSCLACWEERQFQLVYCYFILINFIPACFGSALTARKNGKEGKKENSSTNNQNSLEASQMEFIFELEKLPDEKANHFKILFGHFFSWHIGGLTLPKRMSEQ